MRGVGILVASLLLIASCQPENRRSTDRETVAPSVKPGLEVLLAGHADLVRGRRVGLVTNPTGVDGSLRPAAGLLQADPEIKLVALYGPEHGVRGNAQAGEYVPFVLDPKYGVPVFSLYGQSLKPDPGMLRNMDAYMRSFDTQDSGKMPEASMVDDIDVLLYDIQDVGTRIYTYVATMAYVMQACAEADIEFVILDRPNPINGLTLEGPVLDYPAFSSFVGLYPIPLRHGLTLGELARLFNDRFLTKKARLTVVPAEGWRREMWFDQTGLPWVIPSPNMPTVDTATVYSGQVFFEGTNISEGRGTTKPFELFGAPWIDGYDLARVLNALGLPGVRFREAWFTPTFSKFAGAACGGCQIHVTDRSVYRPLETALHAIKAIRHLYPERFAFHAGYFDKIMGTDRVRTALERGDSVVSIVEGFRAGLAEFEALRKPYLLY
ncbi:MAG: DUF1343 domain-containing protein [Candidatus Aminicenantes bacterium]|nr:DUF1343 domain-containing protein [Candidatus Aminicenantes bacterium]